MTEPAFWKDTEDERARLKAVDACNIMDSPREASFDRIVFTAAQLFRVPTAMLAIVGENRIWLKSSVGPLPSKWELLSTLVVSRNEMLIVEDTAVEHRCIQTPTAAGVIDVRFYLGVPLLGLGNLPVGTLSVVDWRPRTVPEPARTKLQLLAVEAETLLNSRVPLAFSS